MYWTIGAMPELAHLTDAQRRQLLKRSAGCGTYFVLTTRSFMLGVICSVALAAVLWRILPDRSMEYLFGPMLLVSTVGWYRFFLHRIRAALRREVVQAYVGAALPICLACGYDLRGVVPAERCPECGAPVRPSGADRK